VGFRARILLFNPRNKNAIVSWLSELVTPHAAGYPAGHK
jgi:hypothetical protein